MHVKELQSGTGKVDIVLQLTEKAEPRQFDKFGRTGQVCNAKGKDSKGDEITITLWNDQVGQVESGQFIKITNGYVSDYKGTLQLSTGKFGKLEVVTGFEK